MRRLIAAILLVFAAGCGDDGGGPPDADVPRCDTPPGPFEVGDPVGHADPLGAGAGEARAGRLTAADLPQATLGMLTWEEGDLVLANDRVALVIEANDHSDLYDPWGGRPVGLARVESGALVEPADFGEIFVMSGPSTVATTNVSVLADGSDGGPAIVRASGRLAPLPFLEPMIGGLFFDHLTDIEAAIDYTLAPGAEHVDVTFRYASPRPVATDAGGVLHGLMYTPRMATMVPGEGFTTTLQNADWVQLVDEDATSWGYSSPEGPLGSGIGQSGFVGAFTDTFEIAGCGLTERPHARILIGGPGLDGLEEARARLEGRTLRAITGTITDGTAPLAGFRVHATDAAGGYLTRALTDETGAFTVHVPEDAAVTLTAYRRGWATATADVAAGATTAALTVPPSGAIRVRAVDTNGPLPARVQILPGAGSTIPSVPGGYGEPGTVDGRLHVAYPTDGDVTLTVPTGTWDVVVSRGYEYEIVEATVTVTAGATTTVDATLDRVVDTTNVQCGDFHIHTIRSNDAYDDPAEKVRSAVADGLELPVRTEHEWVDTFQPLIEQLGVSPWAYGIGSIEMTSFLIWGHFGVFPLEADPTKANQGAPIWQEWPTSADPDLEVRTKGPLEVLDEVRARPEAPVVIVNHPTGSTEYFDYAGFDPVTGLVAHPEDWDEEFTLVEIFNDNHWLGERDRRVMSWFGLLNTGRPVYAVGSSDSHGIRSSPVGYPRTCIEVGTDDPRELTAELVRDQLAAGHATVSGGVYVTARVGEAGPGDTATGIGTSTLVDVRVQAATWIDVDAIEVVVDGETVATIAIEPGDANPGDPTIRYERSIPIDVAATGSWVVVAAYGDQTLEPVHPNRIPFGVTNPIWLEQ